MADSIASSQEKDIQLGSRPGESSDEKRNRDRKINDKRSTSLIETVLPSTNWVQEDDDDRNDVYRAGSYNRMDRPRMSKGSRTGHYPSRLPSFWDSKFDPVGNNAPSDFIRASNLNPMRFSTSFDDDRSDVYRAVVSSYNSMDNPVIGKRDVKGHPSRFKSFKDLKLDPVGIKKTSNFVRASHPNPMSLSIASSPQTMNIEPFAVSEKPMKKQKKKAEVAHAVVGRALPENIKIKNLPTFYNRCNSIVLLLEKGRRSEEYIRETVAILYTKMKTLPNLTFMQNKKELKFKGSYYHSYEVCYFDATVWRVDEKNAKSGMPGKEYIIEFRRRSLTGHGAFEQLLRCFAGWLYEEKRAEKYGNGFKIYPYEKLAVDIDGLVNDEIFDSPPPSSFEEMSDSESSCEIRLESELICSWAKMIHERSTYTEENIRILAICTKNRENLRLMASEPKLHEALCQEFNEGRNASSCANALLIVKAIFEFYAKTVADSFIDCGMLLSVTRCLLQHSNYKSRGNLRSVAIERAALMILKMLIEYEELWFVRQDWQVVKVLKKLEKYQGRCTDGLEKRYLTDVIKGLKKKTHES